MDDDKKKPISEAEAALRREVPAWELEKLRSQFESNKAYGQTFENWIAAQQAAPPVVAEEPAAPVVRTRMDETNKEVIILHNRGQNDVVQLTDAILRTMATEFWNAGGTLLWLHEGKLVQVSTSLLRSILDQRFTSIELVQYGDTWEVHPCPISIDPKNMTDIISALLLRVARGGAGKVNTLSPQKVSEVRSRARTGESKSAIGKAYGISLEDVSSIVSQQTR
jgi:hypothetical protein